VTVPDSPHHPGGDNAADDHPDAPSTALGRATAEEPLSHGDLAVEEDLAVEDELAALGRTLDAVGRALERLSDGSYGTCRRCGSVLPDARLAVDPTADDCGCGPQPQSSGDPPIG